MHQAAAQLIGVLPSPDTSAYANTNASDYAGTHASAYTNTDASSKSAPLERQHSVSHKMGATKCGPFHRPRGRDTINMVTSTRPARTR